MAAILNSEAILNHLCSYFGLTPPGNQFVIPKSLYVPNLRKVMQKLLLPFDSQNNPLSKLLNVYEITYV